MHTRIYDRVGVSCCWPNRLIPLFYGKVVSQHGSNVQNIRVFNLPPELPDNVLKQRLLEYGKVDRVVREKFPPNLGLDHLYTGVRGIYTDVQKEIPTSR